MSAPIRIVCFDLGGVLLRICRSWEEGCAAAGIPRRSEPRNDLAAARRFELVRLHDVGAITPNDFYREIAATHAGLYSTDEIERIHAAWILGEYPGARALVERINDTGWARSACLSNTNHDHWRQIESYPVIGRLAHRHASHLLRLRKPDDAIYAAFERAVDVRPAEVLFFDDLIENVEAAARRGWRAVHVDHTGDTAEQIERAARASRALADSSTKSELPHLPTFTVPPFRG